MAKWKPGMKPMPIAHGKPPNPNSIGLKPIRIPEAKPRLPPWTPRPQAGQPRRATINQTNTTQSRRYASVGAEGTVIPIIYGLDSIGPIISLVHVLGNNLYLRCVWCQGEIEEILSVSMNDAAVPQSVTMTHYTGSTSQGVDPTLAAVVPGYADTCVVNVDGHLRGIAYSVIVVPRNASDGFPRFIAKINGKRIVSTISAPTVDFSTNPIDVLLDLISDPVQGLGLEVDYVASENAYSYCDDAMADSSKRSEINITLANRQSVDSWIETVRAYGLCFLNYSNGRYSAIPDAVQGSSGTIQESDIVSGTFKPEKRSMFDLPNVVKVYYTSRVTEPPTEEFVEIVGNEVLLGNEFRRESVIQMPGFNTRQQAYRFAVQRLNDANLIDLTGSFDTFDSSWKYDVGDVIEINHKIGLVDKSIRILSIEPVDRGILRIVFTEYNADVYSNEIVSELPPPDSGGINALNPPPVVGLVLGEEFYFTGNNIGSQLTINWTDTPYAYLAHYVLEVYENGVKIVTIRTPDTFYKIRDIAPDTTYSVTIYALSVAFIAGPVSGDSYLAQGYLLPPDFSTGRIAAFEAGDVLYGNIVEPAIDIDLWGYEWRFSRIIDNTHLDAGASTNFISGDWVESGTGSATFTYERRSLSAACTYTSGQSRITTHTCSELVVDKKYDFYLRVRSVQKNNVADTWNLTVVLEFPISGSFVYLVSGESTDGFQPGLYVSKNILITETPTLSVGLEGLTVGSNDYDFDIDFIVALESESDCESDWNNSTFISRNAATSMSIPNLLTDDYIVYAKALDTVRTNLNPFGQYSQQAKFDHASVINESDIFYIQQIVVKPEVPDGWAAIPYFSVNNFQYEAGDGTINPSVIMVPTDNVSWNALFGGTIDSNANPIYSYFETGIDAYHVFRVTAYINEDTHAVASFHCENIPLSGNLIARAFFEAEPFAGPLVSFYLSHFSAKVPFFGFYTSFSIESAAGCKHLFKFDGKTHVKINRNLISESGIATTNAADGSGDPVPKVIVLQNNYTKVIEASAFIETDEPIKAYVDNITFGLAQTTFEIITLNLAGYPVAADVKWVWRGL